MKYILMLMVGILSLQSCSSNNSNESQYITQDTVDKVAEYNKKKSDELIKKHSALKLWIKPRKLSIYYDTILPSNTIAFNGVVKDIDRASGDSLTLTLFRFVPSGKSFIAKVGITDSVANVIQASLSDTTKRDRGEFILQLDNKRLKSMPIQMHSGDKNMAMLTSNNVIVLGGRLKEFFIYSR